MGKQGRGWRKNLDLATVTAIDRASSDDYHRWLRHVGGAAGCSRPIRLKGKLTRYALDAADGEILDRTEVYTNELPDHAVYKACGDRRAAVCPSCAETYRQDAYQLVLAGLRGGKGVPGTVGGHPAVFATLTAPGFGIVHTQRSPNKNDPKPAALPHRSGRHLEQCPHGVAMRCNVKHQEGDHRLGHPLCPDCYEYRHHVVWNAYAGELWRRTTIAANRLLIDYARRHKHVTRTRHPDTGRMRWDKVPVRISFGKVAEFQRRGLVHFHILARFDGIDFAHPDAVKPPPEWANGFLLATLFRQAAEQTTFHTPAGHDHNGHKHHGWPMAWGSQHDIRPVKLRGDDPLTEDSVTAELEHGGRRRLLTGNAVAGYLAKYATKATEDTGHVSRRLDNATIDSYVSATHPGRLIQACWELGTPSLRKYLALIDGEQPTPVEDEGPYERLRRWAHMLGYGGHFFTKSRRYSTTFKRLRLARVFWREAHRTTTEHDYDAYEISLQTVAELTYAGKGWLTTGDALLANTAANQARIRRQAANEEIAAGLAG